MTNYITAILLISFLSNAWGWQFLPLQDFLFTRFEWLDRRPFNCTFCISFWIAVTVAIFMPVDLQFKIIMPILTIIVTRIYYNIFNNGR